MDEKAIEELRQKVNSMLDDKNPGMIKNEQLGFISELRTNFVSTLNGAANTDLEPDVIELLAQIKDPRFLDINDDVQLQAFVGIGDTVDNKPIFISRYARYILAKKIVENFEATEINEHNMKEYQSAQTDLMSSIIKLGKCGTSIESYYKDIVANLQALLDESSLEGLKHVLRNLMLNSNNPVAIKRAFKLMGTFNETFQTLAYGVEKSGKLDDTTTNQIKSVFGVDDEADVNAIFNRLIDVIAIVKKQSKQ